MRIFPDIEFKFELLRHIRPYSPTRVNVNCRLKYFVTLVTYCYNNVFVYFNLQLTLALVNTGQMGKNGRR
jgi:hypothetical protein